MLLSRGARVNATNRGDDTPLHLAAAHGHREIIHMVCIYIGFPYCKIKYVFKNLNRTVRAEFSLFFVVFCKNNYAHTITLF